MTRWQLDLKELLALGEMFDERPAPLAGNTVAIWLATNLLRIRDREGADLPLKANEAQRAFEAERGRKNIVLKARQMGITTWVAGRFFLKTITQPGVLTVQVAQTQAAAEAIFRTVQRFWDCLPVELRDGALKRSKANAGQMCFSALDSEFRVLSAADENAGRGLTIQNLHCSEVSRWPGDAGITLAGLRAALAPGGEMVLESTPNGAYGCFYEEWIRSQHTDTVRHFLPWWMESAYISAPVELPTLEELSLIETHGLNLQQIGFRRGLEKSYKGLRSQEFAEDAETCFKATGECYFDLDRVEQRRLQAPSACETRFGGALQVWFPPQAEKRYLLAVDTAGGGSDGDFAAIQVLDIQSGLQCAELQQHLGPLELARVSAALAKEYGGAFIAVERNNHGAAVLAYLDGVENYSKIYEQDGIAGWLTTAANKPRMMSHMAALLIEQPWLFYSTRLLEECRTFVNMPGGRTGAARGAHDDCVMAMSVGQAVRLEMLRRRTSAMPVLPIR